eukprot:EG_transcript_48320
MGPPDWAVALLLPPTRLARVPLRLPTTRPDLRRRHTRALNAAAAGTPARRKSTLRAVEDGRVSPKAEESPPALLAALEAAVAQRSLPDACRLLGRLAKAAGRLTAVER